MRGGGQRQPGQARHLTLHRTGRELIGGREEVWMVDEAGIDSMVPLCLRGWLYALCLRGWLYAGLLRLLLLFICREFRYMF